MMVGATVPQVNARRVLVDAPASDVSDAENRRWLNAVRLDHLLTIEEAAALFGVTARTWERWESGDASPNWPLLRFAVKGLRFTHGPHCPCSSPQCGRNPDRYCAANGRSYDPRERRR